MLLALGDSLLHLSFYRLTRNGTFMRKKRLFYNNDIPEKPIRILKIFTGDQIPTNPSCQATSISDAHFQIERAAIRNARQ